MRVLIKRVWVVGGTLALIFGATLIATLRSTPIYDAVGSIAINKPDPALQSLQRPLQLRMDYYDPTDLDTEVRILRSDLLALQVIKQLNLDRCPSLADTASPRLPPSDSPPTLSNPIPHALTPC